MAAGQHARQQYVSGGDAGALRSSCGADRELSTWQAGHAAAAEGGPAQGAHAPGLLQAHARAAGSEAGHGAGAASRAQLAQAGLSARHMGKVGDACRGPVAAEGQP